VITCRPEDLAVVGEAGDDRLAAQVSVAIALGPSLVHELTLSDGTEMRVSEMRGPNTRAGTSGEQLFVRIDTSRCHVFPAPGRLTSLSLNPTSNLRCIT